MVNEVTALLVAPTNNHAIAYNTGVMDAARGVYRAPIASLLADYNEGWRKVRPLPSRRT